MIWEQRLFDVNGRYWRFAALLAAWSAIGAAIVNIGVRLWE